MVFRGNTYLSEYSKCYSSQYKKEIPSRQNIRNQFETTRKCHNVQVCLMGIRDDLRIYQTSYDMPLICSPPLAFFHREGRQGRLSLKQFPNLERVTPKKSLTQNKINITVEICITLDSPKKNSLRKASLLNQEAVAESY